MEENKERYEFWEVVQFFKKGMIKKAIRPNSFKKEVTIFYRPGDGGVKQLWKLNGLGVELAMQGITQEDMDAEWGVEFTSMYQVHDQSVLTYLNLNSNDVVSWTKMNISLHEALNRDNYDLLSMVAVDENKKPSLVYIKGGED